jgi:hypothetical protein
LDTYAKLRDSPKRIAYVLMGNTKIRRKVRI